MHQLAQRRVHARHVTDITGDLRETGLCTHLFLRASVAGVAAIKGGVAVTRLVKIRHERAPNRVN